MYPYPAANRVSEMFDALKKDFDSLVNDVNRYKTQREDYERKGAILPLLSVTKGPNSF